MSRAADALSRPAGASVLRALFVPEVSGVLGDRPSQAIAPSSAGSRSNRRQCSVFCVRVGLLEPAARRTLLGELIRSPWWLAFPPGAPPGPGLRRRPLPRMRRGEAQTAGSQGGATVPQSIRETLLLRLASGRGAKASACAVVGAAALAVAPGSHALTLGKGAWSYFGDPRAVHAQGRTFVGWAGRDGRTHVAAFDRRGLLEHRRIGPRLPRDDHNNPSLHIKPDGRIMVVYSAHAGPTMYTTTSRRPLSVASFTRSRRFPTNTRGRSGYTYPNPMRVNGALWLMWRGANREPTYSVFRRGRWAPARTLVRGPGQHRPYAKYATDRGVIHGTFTEGGLGSYPNSVYYARIRNGAFYTAAGRFIAPLGKSPPVRRLEKVRPFEGLSQWTLDIAIDETGSPVVVYRRGQYPVEYWYARFNGRNWENHLIIRYAGPAHPPGGVGGLTLDHEDPSTVYVSRINRSGGKHEIEVWVTPDGGQSWSVRALTQNSGSDNLRPVSPRGLFDFEQVLWFAGTRLGWRSFRTDIIAHLADATE